MYESDRQHRRELELEMTSGSFVACDASGRRKLQADHQSQADRSSHRINFARAVRYATRTAPAMEEGLAPEMSAQSEVMSM